MQSASSYHKSSSVTQIYDDIAARYKVQDSLKQNDKSEFTQLQNEIIEEAESRSSRGPTPPSDGMKVEDFNYKTNAFAILKD